MKICNACKQNLSINKFTINKATKDGFSNRCKECYNSLRKNYYVPKEKFNSNEIKTIELTSKFCKGCKEILSIENFMKTKLVKDGYENKCKVCRNKQRKVSAQVNQKNILLNNIEILEKKCKICKLTKTIENFSKDSSRGDGFETACKECKNIYHKKYMKNEDAKIKSRFRIKKYKINHPNVSKIYYQNNKKIIIEKTKFYCKSTYSGRYTSLKISAKQRKIDFCLSKEFVGKFWNSNCFYCDIKLDKPSFDRINSDLNYTEDNVIPCCKNCNYMKNSLSVSDFLQHLNKILNFKQNQIYENRLPVINYTDNQRKNYYLSPNGRFLWYKKMAENRKIQFDLRYNEFVQFWQKPCSYCGSTIDTIGLDRYDNNIGYNISNIKSCCFTCNSMKREFSYEVFIKHCEMIINNKNKFEVLNDTRSIKEKAC